MGKAKTNIVCFGNCQAMQLVRYFKTYLDPEQYEINLYSNYDKKFTTQETIDGIANADIVIYQPLSHEHKDLSADKISTITDAKLISFPYIYNNGIYSLETDGTKIIGEDTILALYKDGYTLEEIIKMQQNGQIDFKLKEKFQKSLNIMKEREKDLDIKITDFIEKYYREVQLFLSHNHPTNIVFNEVFKQIVNILDLKIINEKAAVPPLCETVAPITIHDKNAHGYKWNPYRFHSVHASMVIIELIISRYVIKKNNFYMV